MSIQAIAQASSMLASGLIVGPFSPAEANDSLPTLVLHDFVQKLMKFGTTWPGSLVQPFLSADSMLSATKRLLSEQKTYLDAGKPTKVDIGFHYTREEHVASIRQHGLMSRRERRDHGIRAITENGASFGEGIYTASNASAFHGRYGAIGLVVIRLQGRNIDFVQCRRLNPTTNDSLTVHRNCVNEIVVLASSCQCIPILQFNASSIMRSRPRHFGSVSLDEFLCQIQGLVNPVFNVNTKPPSSVGQSLTDTSLVAETIKYTKPSAGCFESKANIKFICFPSCGRACEVCLCNKDSPLVQREQCKHVFHLSCAMQFDPVCPTCSQSKGLHGLVGKMPSGTMTAKASPLRLHGYHNTTSSIVIDYIIPSDVQAPYHKNPGVRFNAIHRRAYLPNTPHGLDLLKRLKYAFRHGLTFKVGVSMTTGKDNSVTWASIAHKTNTIGGPRRHGYPDPDYFVNCNNELDRLCVPAASSL